MPEPTEKPNEAPKPSPNSAGEVAKQVTDFLEQLKIDVEKEINPDEKKKLVKERFEQLSKEGREELSKRVEGQQAGIPRELLDDLIGVLELTDERKAALRAEIGSGTTETKPEGWLGWAGSRLHAGGETLKEWGKGAWEWTEKWGGKGWDQLVNGFKAVGDGFVRLWEIVKGPLNKAREGIAVAFGGVLISMEKILPAWVKDGFNLLVGHYGVFYATINRLGVKIKEGATEIVQGAQEQVKASVETFAGIYDQAKEWGKTNLDFPGFIRAIAKVLRDRKHSVEFTLAEMVALATDVQEGRITLPLTPGAAPAAAPAPVPVEQLVRTEVQSFPVNGFTVAMESQGSEKLLKIGERKFRMTTSVALISAGLYLSKAETASDGSLFLTGNVGYLPSGVVRLLAPEVSRLAPLLSQSTGTFTENVTYRDSAGAEQKKPITFVLVPSS